MAERERGRMKPWEVGRKRLQPLLKNTSLRRVISSRFLLFLYETVKMQSEFFPWGKPTVFCFASRPNEIEPRVMCKYVYIIHTRDILNGCAKL